MKENSGTIAVIIPMYNAQDTIVRAVRSVINQSYQDWMLYIIDDKSADSSLKIVRDNFHDPRIIVIENKNNLGAAETRNVGITISKEKFIAFLDSDDEWESNKLSLQAASLSCGENIIVTHYSYIKSIKNIIEYKKDYLTQKSFIKKTFRVCFSSLCYRRPEKDVKFRNKGHEDFLFIYELMQYYPSIKVIHQSLVNYYAMNDSLSGNKSRAAKWHLNILKMIYRNPFKVGYYYCWYMINGIDFSLRYR